MRATSLKSSALVAALAVTGFLSAVSARPLCSSSDLTSSGNTCPDGDVVVDHWPSRRDAAHHSQRRAFRLPGGKGPDIEEPDFSPAPPGGGPSGPVPNRPNDGEDLDQPQSGPVSGTPFNTVPDAPPANPVGVLDVKTKGYTFENLPAGPGMVQYKVKNANGDIVADLRVDNNQKMIIAEDLRFDTDVTPDRARAWEVEMSAFQHESKLPPSELKALDYPLAEQPETRNALNGIIANKGTEEPFTIAKGDPDFDTIMQTPLGKSGQNIADNVPGVKPVERVEVRPGDSDVDEDPGLTLYYGA